MVVVSQGEAGSAKVALKAHRFLEPYLREKQVYERLKQTGVTAVRGFNVPTLLGFDGDLRVLEMTIGLAS